MLEKIQRHATKFILNDYTSSYKDRLTNLSLLLLMYWFFELNDVMYLVNLLKCPPDNFSVSDYSDNPTRFSNMLKLKHNFCQLSTSRHFYFNRIVRLWNQLPPIDLNLPICSIQRMLFDHLWGHFVSNFDVSNSCTYVPVFSVTNFIILRLHL